MKKSIENKAIIEALKEVATDGWKDSATHATMEAALVAVNDASGINSGWYNPKAVKVEGLEGFFMVNENGGLWYESRIIEASNGFTIQNMTLKAFNEFEANLGKHLDRLEK
jgi:predicted GNAT superfamily acetyltransferase